MAKVTLSLDEQTLSRAREQAEREGLTLSAWMATAARRHAQRDAGRRYREWLSKHPDIRDEVESLAAAFSPRSRPDWWSELGEPAA
jgi:hypothetical protein